LASPSEVVSRGQKRAGCAQNKRTMNVISEKDENGTSNYRKTTNASSTIDEDHLSPPLSQRLRFGSTHSHVGLSHGASNIPSRSSLEKDEERVRTQIERKWRLMHCLQTNVANCLVFIIYLITIETTISCGLTVGLTYYWHLIHKDSTDWYGGSIDFVLLGFG